MLNYVQYLQDYTYLKGNVGEGCLVGTEIRPLNCFERKILIPHNMQYIVQFWNEKNAF